MEKTPTSFYIVRFNDCDPLGHLNNSKYIDYFINAREDHLRDHYSIDLKEWAQQGIAFVVTQHEIRYLRPATYNEIVGIQTALIGWGDTWLQVEMLMLDKNHQPKAICWTKFTRIDPSTGKKAVHPPEFREFIDQALVAEFNPEAGLAARVDSLRR
jgi:YbgC/YbaW family acyl-CoA thioester hydrolase